MQVANTFRFGNGTGHHGGRFGWREAEDEVERSWSCEHIRYGCEHVHVKSGTKTETEVPGDCRGAYSRKLLGFHFELFHFHASSPKKKLVESCII